jgi:hypothetical protein
MAHSLALLSLYTVFCGPVLTPLAGSHLCLLMLSSLIRRDT